MKSGKLSQSIFERSVLKQFQKEQIGNYKGAGNVCAFLPVMCTVETFAAAHEGVAAYAVYMAANALLAKGGKPSAATVSLVLTMRQSEAFLKKVMKSTSDALAVYGMCLADVSVEIIDAVAKPFAAVTVIGEPVEPHVCFSVSSGMDIVMTKWLALGATAILADICREEILAKYPIHLLENAKAMQRALSVQAEAATAVKSGVGGMWHVNKGGIFGALWEMADWAGVGLIIDLKKIPVKQETIEISEMYDVNPYELLGCGSLLLAAEDGYGLVGRLKEEGIAAGVIGKTTDNHDRIIRNDEESRYLEPAKPDEILKILQEPVLKQKEGE